MQWTHRSTPACTPMSSPRTPAMSTDVSKSQAAVVFPSHVRRAVARAPPDFTGDLVRLLDDISTVSRSIAAYCNAGSESVSYGTSGERGRLSPEVACRQLYSKLVYDGYACLILERTRENPMVFPEDAPYGDYVVMLSSLDTDVEVDEHAVCGTVFSVYKRLSPRATPGKMQDLEQTLGRQVAAGYVIYSSATSLCYTVGPADGTHSFVLHPVAKQYFHQPTTPLQMPIGNNDVYVDYTKLRCDQMLLKAVKKVAAAADPPGALFDLNCFVASFHAAMIGGGLVVLPEVHMLCEAGPAALLCERMGGKATDGRGARILDLKVDAKEPHSTTTFCAGPASSVDALERAVSAFDIANGR